MQQLISNLDIRFRRESEASCAALTRRGKRGVGERSGQGKGKRKGRMRREGRDVGQHMGNGGCVVFVSRNWPAMRGEEESRNSEKIGREKRLNLHRTCTAVRFPRFPLPHHPCGIRKLCRVRLPSSYSILYLLSFFVTSPFIPFPWTTGNHGGRP